MPLPISAIWDKESGRLIVQTTLPPFACLALEGAGVRGGAFAGLAKIFEKYGVFEEVQYISGSSAGAIAALMMALGYTAEECCDLLYNLPIKEFLEGAKLYDSLPNVLQTAFQAFSIWARKEHSLSSGKMFLKWLEVIVEKKLGHPKANFSDLEKAINNNPEKFKYLYVAATNLSLPIKELEIFSHETTPDAPLALAVSMSSAFPFVFKPVLWRGYYYADGGLKNNLLVEIFDRKKFVPEGYLRKRRRNPCIVAVKIDTKEEINQLYSKETVGIETASDLASAYINALTDRVDIQEMREKRKVIALPDGDIHTLEFKIDENGKYELLSSAEKATQEFLENHIRSAFDVKTYKNPAEWFECLSLNELEAILQSYNEMALCCADPDEARQIKQYVNVIRQYMHEKIDECNCYFPSIPHVNLKTKRMESHWSIRLKTEMENRLKMIAHQIQKNKEAMQGCLSNQPINQFDDLLKLHDAPSFEDLKRFVGYEESIKVLMEEKWDLENKLNIKHEDQYQSFDFKSFKDLYDAFVPLLTNKNLSVGLKIVLKEIDKYRSSIVYRSSIEHDNVLFMLNLNKSLDQKLYFIAALIYLKHKKDKGLYSFQELYCHLFNENPFQEKWTALASVLNQQGVDLLASAYRIEELIHFFEKIEHPNKKCTIDIDHVFGAKNYSIFNIKLKSKTTKKPENDQDQEVHLKNIFNTPLMFRGSSHQKINVPDQSMTNDEDSKNTPSWFFGKSSYDQ